ncbi:MAG: hypothetical protein H6819_01175 [Phycisphaerales bacterium]|nr:hypothetical protein [Phycisphaerales bacterium]MCB9857180.1 hypothetical protein [Phycisphaerales bacterium]MCB9863107.1 hypothetical protein [Phycisphaerales bacterium]
MERKSPNVPLVGRHRTNHSIPLFARFIAMALVILSGALTPALADDLIIGTEQSLGVTGQVEEFTIPVVDPPSVIRLSLFGADGGEAVAQDGDCSQPGGQGATVIATFRIGFGFQELRPGGTIRFVVGMKGGNGNSAANASAGGGGGGTGVMYRGPGVPFDICEDDWITLAAAGGGGGAYQAWDLGCVDGEAGGDARIDTCGGDGESAGGGGAYVASSEADAGCPIGGVGGPGDGVGGAGGWGFGGGGGANQHSGGGGGGYSGGGGGTLSRAGGGGGSYVSSWAFNISKQTGNGGRLDGQVTYLATDDICPGFDDDIDTDNDGIPNGCDLCEGSADNLDQDGDGIPDGCDSCPGSDDALDSDNDGIADGCDACPNDEDNADADNDGVSDCDDLCPDTGVDAAVDGDGCPLPASDVNSGSAVNVNSNDDATDDAGSDSAAAADGSTNGDDGPAAQEVAPCGCGQSGMMLMPIGAIGFIGLRRRLCRSVQRRATSAAS